jgi:hypothetical protein
VTLRVHRPRRENSPTYTTSSSRWTCHVRRRPNVGFDPTPDPLRLERFHSTGGQGNLGNLRSASMSRVPETANLGRRNAPNSSTNPSTCHNGETVIVTVGRWGVSPLLPPDLWTECAALHLIPREGSTYLAWQQKSPDPARGRTGAQSGLRSTAELWQGTRCTRDHCSLVERATAAQIKSEPRLHGTSTTPIVQI